MYKKKILIGLCTFKRHRMLKRCLDSLLEIYIPEDAYIEIIVVNNDVEALPEEIINSYNRAPFKFLFHQVIDRGIPHARNFILKYANEKDFDFCAFLDDDEYAEKDWLINLCTLQAEMDADVVQGQVINDYQKRSWLFAPLLKKEKINAGHQERIFNVSMCNVLVSKKLYAESQLGLRFDHFFALTGGSDKDFFDRACPYKHLYYFTDKAIVHEEIPEERVSFRWFFTRFARVENNKFFFRKKSNGYIIAFIKLFPDFMINIFKLLILMPILIISIASPKMFRRCFLKIFKSISRIWGFLKASLGLHINTYGIVTGD